MLVGDSPYIDRIRVSGPADVVILVPSHSRVDSDSLLVEDLDWGLHIDT